MNIPEENSEDNPKEPQTDNNSELEPCPKSIIQEKQFIISTLFNILMIFVLAFSIYVNANLASSQRDWEKQRRKMEISPRLQILPTTGFSDNFEYIDLIFKNVGNGIAKDIFLFAECDSNFNNIGIYEYKLESDEKLKQKFIMPNQALRARIHISDIMGFDYNELSLDQKTEMMLPAIFTFYFSFYDQDKNEYLFIAKFPPSSTAGPIVIIDKSSSIIDELKRLSSKMPSYTENVFINPGLRDKYGWFSEKIDDKSK